MNATAAINVDGDSGILRGVDPTSYAAGKAPQVGDAKHTAVSDGAIHRFASSDAQDRFNASPSTYKPAFGGFCAAGAALGKKLDGDPEIFRILDGQLYVFVHQQAVEIWDEDPAGTLAKANANWPQTRTRRRRRSEPPNRPRRALRPEDRPIRTRWPGALGGVIPKTRA